MSVELHALRAEDAEAHCAGEDAQTVRWLTGGYGSVEDTRRYFEMQATNAASGQGKRGFGVRLDGRLAGYVDCDPDTQDGLEAGEVNISYAVHPWVRGRGVAVEAVRLMCRFIQVNELGRRAAIRVEPENTASVRVAEKCGFTYVRDFVSGSDGTPTTMSLYLREL